MATDTIVQSDRQYVVLDAPVGNTGSPGSNDVVLDNGTLYIRNTDPIPLKGVLNTPAQETAQTEQTRQVDLTPTVNNNEEYVVLLRQPVGNETEEIRFTYVSGDNASADEIVNALRDKINAQNKVQVTASNNTSNLRIDADAGTPVFQNFQSGNFSESVNTAGRYARGQGDDLIEEGISDATSGNDYSLWYFRVDTNIGHPVYTTTGQLVKRIYVYANEGWGSFAGFRDELNDYLNGYDGSDSSTLSNEHVALTG